MIVQIDSSALIAAVDALLKAAHSQPEHKAIDTAYEMMGGAAFGQHLVTIEAVDGVYRIASRTQADTFYLTTVYGCDCPAGLHNRHCWHRKFVILLEQFRKPTQARKRREPSRIEELFN
jgi:hypothetical protein